uniref:Acetyl-coenzyme A carboxylase carboxyl transferase subunit beta, chloroplastic n=1 Tax=Pseudotaxus chienii TaxID=89481 RepID=A0A140GA90_9CONI|nr:acetyl-CoA carboxylase beta subunit [Pseudotaxus chienii]AMM72281.1 acetyl-CoA carboxylase, carboxyl transferase subunit beta [Pseudotaxus chienii]AZN62448.1 AccD [Pseudotaxus chienii]QBK34372.1 acetyl-CoA carboxylase beta subunit [Pseudotaxus chienii]
MCEENKDREYIEEKVEKDRFDQRKYKHLWVLCENCENVTFNKSLVEEFKGVCPKCGETLLMTSSDRIDLLIDPGTWCPMDADLSSLDLLEKKDKIHFFNIVTVREVSELFYEVISHEYYNKSAKTFKTLVGFNNTIVNILRVVIYKNIREYLTRYVYVDSQSPIEMLQDIICTSLETIKLLMVQIDRKMTDEINRLSELYPKKIYKYVDYFFSLYPLDFNFVVFYGKNESLLVETIQKLYELRQKLADLGDELQVIVLHLLIIEQDEIYSTFIDDSSKSCKNTDKFKTLREDVFHEIEECYLHNNLDFEIEKFIALFEEALLKKELVYEGGVVKLVETIGSNNSEMIESEAENHSQFYKKEESSIYNIEEESCNIEKDFCNEEFCNIEEEYCRDYVHLYQQENDKSIYQNVYTNQTLNKDNIEDISYEDYLYFESHKTQTITIKDTCIEDTSYIEDIEDIPYEDYNDSYQKETGLPDAIQTGIGRVNGIAVAIGVMDFKFMGGSMGSVVGEKITRLIQHATKNYLPVILVCASGGARMQEGSFSLMQMSKIAAALHTHQKEKNLLYISILTSPTTGGVTASFGMLANVTIVEPNAYIAFAGRRVIEQTLNQIVEEESQTSDSLFDFGMFDVMVPRAILKKVLSEIMKIITFRIEKSK